MRKPVSASRQEPCRESEVALSVVTIVDQLFCRRAETLTMSNALFPAAPSYKKETQNAVFLPDTSDPTFPQCKNTNATPQPTRFRQAGNKRRKTAIERQHIVNGLQELLKIFKDATWEDAKLEPLVDYHFVFTLRLFLTHESSDIRTIAVHTLRHASLSDRILQLYTDLFIAELVVIRLYHETKTLCKTTPEDIQQLPVDEHPALCGIQERVSALKFIRHWFALTVSHKTIIPIPSCLFLGLVDVGNNQLSLPPDVGIITLKSKNVDPLRFFCLELLRDMALRLEFPLIRRFAAAGGITALVNAATDCVAFEVEPAFCCTLVVTISKLLGESGLKQPMYETAVVTLPSASEPHFLPLNFIMYAEGCSAKDPWNSWWFLEVSSLCSALLRILPTPIPTLYKLKWIAPKLIHPHGAGLGKCARCHKTQGSNVAEGFEQLNWKAATTAFFTLCRTFSGLLAVVTHPYGLRSLVKLLWQPLDTASRLELVIFFTRLLFIGLSFDGRPIQCHEDLFNLFFTRYVRSRLLKNVAEKPKLCRPFTLTNKKFPVGPTSQRHQQPQLSKMRRSGNGPTPRSLQHVERKLDGLVLSVPDQTLSSPSSNRCADGVEENHTQPFSNTKNASRYFNRPFVPVPCTINPQKAMSKRAALFGDAESSAVAPLLSSPILSSSAPNSASCCLDKTQRCISANFCRPNLLRWSTQTLAESDNQGQGIAVHRRCEALNSHCCFLTANWHCKTTDGSNKTQFDALSDHNLQPERSHFLALEAACQMFWPVVPNTDTFRSSPFNALCDTDKQTELFPYKSHHMEDKTSKSTATSSMSFTKQCNHHSVYDRTGSAALPFLNQPISQNFSETTSNTDSNNSKTFILAPEPAYQLEGHTLHPNRRNLAHNDCTISSLTALSSPEPMGFNCLELTLMSGFSYGTSVDLRDIHGLLLLRKFLEEELHLALATLLISLQSSVTKYENILKFVIYGGALHYTDSSSNSTRKKSKCSVRLLLCSAQLLAVLLCVASFILPRPVTKTSSRSMSKKKRRSPPLSTTIPACGSCHLLPNLKDLKTHGQHRSLQPSLANNLKKRLKNHCHQARLCAEAHSEAWQRSTQSLAAVLLQAQHGTQSTHILQTTHPLTSNGLSSWISRPTQKKQFVRASFSNVLTPFRKNSETTKGVSKPTQADNTLTRHEEDLQPDTTPLVQAQKLLHYFFHFISLNFLSRENPPVDFQARLLPTIFTGCSKTCFDFFKQWKPKVKNDFCDTFAAAQQITKCKQTGKILTKAVSCDTDHIRHMKQILSYSRFYSGPVAHGGACTHLHVLRTAHVVVPFHQPGSSVPPETVLNAYIRATRVVSIPFITPQNAASSSRGHHATSVVTDDTFGNQATTWQPTEDPAMLNSAFSFKCQRPDVSLSCSDLTLLQLVKNIVVKLEDAFAWNWEMIHRILMELVYQLLHQLPSAPFAKHFFAALFKFFLPSSRLFSTQRWGPDLLHWVLAGTRLMLILSFIDEPVIVPKPPPCIAPKCTFCATSLNSSSSTKHGRFTPFLDGPLSIALVEEKQFPRDHFLESKATKEDIASAKEQFVKLRRMFIRDVVDYLSIEICYAQRQKCLPTISVCVEDHVVPSTSVFRREQQLFHSTESWKRLVKLSKAQPPDAATRSSSVTSSATSDSLTTSNQKQRFFSRFASINAKPRHRFRSSPSPFPHSFKKQINRTLRGSKMTTSGLPDSHTIQFNKVGFQRSAKFPGHTNTFVKRNKQNSSRSTFNVSNNTLRSSSYRLFDETRCRDYLTREYATLIGIMSYTRSGLLALLSNRFFQVLEHMITLHCRDDLVLLFLKQLSMNYLPCRGLLETAVLYGSTYLRYKLVNHYSLIVEGVGLQTPFSEIPFFTVTCEADTLSDALSDTEDYLALKNQYYDKSTFFSDCEPVTNHCTSAQRHVCVTTSQCKKQGEDREAKSALNTETQAEAASYVCERCSIFFQIPRSLLTQPSSYLGHNKQQTAFQQCSECVSTGKTKLPLNESLVACKAPWLWVITWGLYLVLAVRPTSQKLATAMEEYIASQYSLADRKRKAVWCETPRRSTTAQKLLHGKRNKNTNDKKKMIRIVNLKQFLLVSELVAYKALRLVITLCKVGGAPVVNVLNPYLPQEETSGIRLPRLRSFSCLTTSTTPVFWSALCDWPSCLKLQLLQTEKGALYLIKTGWLLQQLRLYCVYSHNMLGCRIASQLRDLTDSDDENPLAKQDVSETLSCLKKSSTEIICSKQQRLADVKPPKSYKTFERTANTSSCLFQSQLQKKTLASTEKPQLLYIALIDGLLKRCFWNVQSLSPGAGAYFKKGPKMVETEARDKYHDNPPLRHCVIPDAYRYHFYCANGLEKDSVLPIPLKENNNTDNFKKQKFQTLEEQEDIPGGAAERGPILMTYKRIAQQRHQRSPLEFLSYIPFYFVVQLFEGIIDHESFAVIQEHVFDASIVRCLDSCSLDSVADSAALTSAMEGSAALNAEFPTLFLPHHLTPSPGLASVYPLLSVADLSGNSVSFKLLSLFCLTLPCSVSLRCCLRVGRHYVREDGLICEDPHVAFWSIIKSTELPLNLLKTVSHLAEVHQEQAEAAKTERCFHGERVYPLVVRASCFVWTFCVHTETSYTTPEITIKEPEHAGNAGADFRNAKVTSIRLLQIETDVDTTYKYSQAALKRDLFTRIKRKQDAKRNLQNFLAIPTTGPTKPPANLMTYVALTQTGLDFLRSTRFLQLLETELKPENVKTNTEFLSRRSNTIIVYRSLAWTVGHILSSERGVFYLFQKTTLLHQLVQMAYNGGHTSLRGTCLYALGLIPITIPTKSLLSSLGWDLIARGPSHDQFSFFLTGRFAPNTVLATHKPQPKQPPPPNSEMTKEPATSCPTFRSVHPTFCKQSENNTKVPCDKDLAQLLTHIAKFTRTSDVLWCFSGKGPILLKSLAIKLPLNVVAGFDLSNLLFKTSFKSSDLAQFALSMLEHQRTGGASQCNHPISPQTGFPTYLSTTGHQQLLASTVPKMWAKSNSVKHFLTRLSVDTCVPCHYIAYVTFPQPSSSLKKTFPAVLHKLDNGVIRSTLGFLPTAQASHSIETSFHVTTSAMLNKEHCLALSSKSRNNVDRKNCGGWSKPIITKNALHNNKAPIKDTLSKVPEITSVCPKDFVAGRKAMNAEDACVSIKNAENKEGCYNACPEKCHTHPQDFYRRVNSSRADVGVLSTAFFTSGTKQSTDTTLDSPSQIQADFYLNSKQHTCLPWYQQYTEKHQEILSKVASLMNNVTVHTEDLIPWFEQLRKKKPHLYLSVELWWRIQMLFRIYQFPANHKLFVLRFFSDTFKTLDAWFYLDLLTQYVKWNCTLPSFIEKGATTSSITQKAP